MCTDEEGILSKPISQMFFEIPDIIGRWCSREGSPSIRVYRSRKDGGRSCRIAITYPWGDVVHRPVLSDHGAHYFDLFGWVSLSYDSLRDVLMLSCYGNYYRVE